MNKKERIIELEKKVECLIGDFRTINKKTLDGIFYKKCDDFLVKKVLECIKKINALYKYLNLEFINQEYKTNIVRKLNKSKK